MDSESLTSSPSVVQEPIELIYSSSRMGEDKSLSISYRSYQVIKLMGRNIVKENQEDFNSTILMLFNIAIKYRLTEVEIIIWSLYIETIPYQPMNAEYCAYASKVFSNADTQRVNSIVPVHIKESFNVWATNSKLRFQLSFYEINRRYIQCNSDETGDDEQNYNDYVEAILNI